MVWCPRFWYTFFFCLLWRCLETLLLQCDGNDVQSQGQQEKEEKFLATDQEAGLCPGSRRAWCRTSGQKFKNCSKTAISYVHLKKSGYFFFFFSIFFLDFFLDFFSWQKYPKKSRFFLCSKNGKNIQKNIQKKILKK